MSHPKPMFKRGSRSTTSTIEATGEWVGGRFQMPAFVNAEAPYRPDIVLWADVTEGVIVGSEIVEPTAPPEAMVDCSSHFWSGLASAMHRLCPKEQMHVIEKAYEDELIEPFFICRKDFEDGLKRSEDAALKDVRHDMGCRMPDDVHKHMSWWACLNERKPATGHTAPVAVAPGTKPKKRKDARKRQKAARKQGCRRR